MEWVIAALVVVLIGLAALAGTGAFGGQRREPVRDVYRQPLPGTPLTSADLDAVRFGVTIRGYAMGQVDDVLDRLRDDLATLEQEVVRLRAGAGAPEVAQPDDPFAEYDLDGGQGLPNDADWADGDGRIGERVEDSSDDEFLQYPRSAGIAARAPQTTVSPARTAPDTSDGE